MSLDPRLGKAVKVENVTATRVFSNFESLLLIDAGATDGFKITDESGNVIVIPTGIPVSIGGPNALISSEITVSAPDGGSLDVSAIWYS